MSEIKLLPCPFCGGEAKFITGSPFIWEHAVACGECGTATRMIGGVIPSMARNRVAQVWNTRKPMQEIVERLEKRKAQLEKAYNGGYGIPFEQSQCNGAIIATENDIRIVKEVGGMND